MKKKILAVLLSAAMVAAMAMGCSSGGGTSAKADGEKAGKAEDMTFVVVPKCVHAWFDEVNKGAQKEADLLAEQLGVKVKIDYRAPEQKYQLRTQHLSRQLLQTQQLSCLTQLIMMEAQISLKRFRTEISQLSCLMLLHQKEADLHL